jgi:signal transduction histidine kinase
MIFKKKSQIDFFLHELKNPLTSILGAVEALHDIEKLDTAKQKRFIQIIEQKAARLRMMLENALTTAELSGKSPVKKFAAIHLVEVIHPVLENLKEQIEAKNIKLQVHVPQDIKVLAQSQRLQTVFSNLIDNAVKYSPAQGVVELKTVLTNKKVVVSISDQGPGIALNDQKKIFNRYFRSASQGQVAGHGLGLAIVRSILKTHRSRIQVKSHLGKGTMFIFDLPLVKN